MTPNPATPLTEKEISLLQAMAGIEAARVAAASGGSTAEIASLMQAGQAQDAGCIGGRRLHGQTLQVVLCLQLLEAHVGKVSDTLQQIIEHEQPGAESLQMLARLGYIFTCPREAYESLADVAAAASDELEKETALRALDSEALEVTGEWAPADMQTLARHLLTLGKPETPTPSA